MRRRALLAAAPAALLAGCGFELRGAVRLPFDRIALVNFMPKSPLAEELRRTLVAAQVRLVEPAARAEVVLHAITDRREKVVVASTTASQVREFQLRVRLEFRVETPGGRELVPATELLLTRDMSYSETFALAKEQEEATLYRAMQSDIVAQLMRRLAQVKLA